MICIFIHNYAKKINIDFWKIFKNFFRSLQFLKPEVHITVCIMQVNTILVLELKTFTQEVPSVGI